MLEVSRACDNQNSENQGEENAPACGDDPLQSDSSALQIDLLSELICVVVGSAKLS